MGILSTVASGASKVATFAAENSQPILTFIEWASVGGAVATGIKTTARVVRDIDEENRYRTDHNEPPMSEGEIIRAALPEYGATIVFLGVFIGANCLKAHFNKQHIATLAALYSLEKANDEEYKRKTREMLGERKEQKIRDEVYSDTAKEVKANTIVMYSNSTNGTHPCMFYWSKTGPFMSNKNIIESVKNDFNSKMIGGFDHPTLKEFFNSFGIPEDKMPSFAYDVGWNADHLIDLYYSSGFTADGVPMLIVDFREEPSKDYLKTF